MAARKPTTKGKKPRRPTSYTKAKADQILKRMALGETLMDICKCPSMPSRPTVHDWRKARPDFADAYARAREDQMHSWCEEIIGLVDNAEPDWTVDAKRSDDDVFQADGKPDGRVVFKFQRIHLERAKAMAHERKWVMSKVLPAMYGDRQQVDVNLNVAEKDDQELLHELSKIMTASGLDVEDLVGMIQTAARPQ